jgi:multidrug efflux system membrane fusion protein
MSKPAPFPQHSFPWLHRGRLLLLTLGLIGLSACAASDAQSAKSGKGGDKRPVPVVLATATRKSVPIFFRTTGNVQAYSTVSVTSQVDGQLNAVYFKEGQEVRKGDPLFTIDPRPLEAALDAAIANQKKAVAQVGQAQAAVVQAKAQVNQAKATVAKDLAVAKNATVQAQRYTSLLKEGAVSQDQAGQFSTNAESQSAVVAADQSNVGNAIAGVGAAQANLENARAAVRGADAAVDSARVQLSYTAINSPIDGRTGSLKVNQGNLVKANDTNPLVVISQIRPIYVTFSVPQRLIPDIKKYQSQRRLEVDVMPQKDMGTPIRGELVFIDSAVDTTTGTIQLKASFANLEGRLTPGQFVNVVLKLTEQQNAIVVPTSAVQAGQKGSFVYVVKADNTVDVRQVATGEAVSNQTVIQKGLQPGDRVVTDGQFNLTPGATVQEKKEAGAGTEKNQG